MSKSIISYPFPGVISGSISGDLAGRVPAVGWRERVEATRPNRAWASAMRSLILLLAISQLFAPQGVVADSATPAGTSATIADEAALWEEELGEEDIEDLNKDGVIPSSSVPVVTANSKQVPP